MAKIKLSKVQITAIICIIILAVIIYLFYNKTSSDNNVSNLPYSQDNLYPIGNGSIGPHVAQLQTALNNKYNAGLAVDGIWGPYTQAACLKYLGVGEVSQSLLTSIL